MQNLYRIFCQMIVTIPQSYYIQQLLTIDHDCPVPVDKHGSVKMLPHPFDPKVKYLHFAILRQLSIFLLKFCMQAEEQ